MNPILLTVAGNPENQDRGVIVHHDTRVVLCVADGAGGRSGGAEAAQMAVEFVKNAAELLTDSDACADLLRRMDAAVANDTIAGETTCALTVVARQELFGASVGDSGIWLIQKEGAVIDLTGGQQRKPFIGSGMAWPVSFRHPICSGSLLLATDGLFKYTSAERIIKTCQEISDEVATQRLIELVRYPSGAMPDDVTLILIRL